MSCDIAIILGILRSQTVIGSVQPNLLGEARVTPPDGNLPPPPDYNAVQQYDDQYAFQSPASTDKSIGVDSTSTGPVVILCFVPS